LASLGPVPLWLCSLALFIPNLLSNVVVGGLALLLLCSVRLIYHWAYALFGMREDLKAMQIAMVIAGTGLLAWLLLVQLVLVQG
jgi:hypothetical protein